MDFLARNGTREHVGLLGVLEAMVRIDQVSEPKARWDPLKTQHPHLFEVGGQTLLQ